MRADVNREEDVDEVATVGFGEQMPKMQDSEKAVVNVLSDG